MTIDVEHVFVHIDYNNQNIDGTCFKLMMFSHNTDWFNAP